MAKIFLIVEGQTEEQFYKRVVQEAYQTESGVFSHYFEVVVMPNKKNTFSREQKGGSVSYEVSVTNIKRFLRSTTHCDLVVMIFDYYGLHQSFKSHLRADQNTLDEKITAIQHRLENEIAVDKFKFRLQIHEFEAFLFSDPEVIANHFGLPGQSIEINSILDAVNGNPEFINDHPETAPSKRLARIFPNFRKITDGLLIAEKIGIAVIRGKCKNFNALCKIFDTL